MNMTRTAYTSRTYKKQVRREATEQFFLFVAFHSAWSAILNFFHD